MRTKLTILLITLIFFGCEDSRKTQMHTLIIKKDACKIENQKFVILPELRLKKDGKLISIHERELSDNYFQIDSLEMGNYQIEFETMFKQTEIENITIGRNTIDTLVVCVDKINYESIRHEPFIDRIGENESFEMTVTSRGCFHFDIDTVTVIRKQDKILVQFNDKMKTLTSGEIDAFRKFELELIHMNTDICSTTEYYTLKYRDQILKIADGSCFWWGHERLSDMFFN